MHTTTTARSLFDVLPRTAQPGADGRLTVGACALADVAAEFGTPALVNNYNGARRPPDVL